MLFIKSPNASQFVTDLTEQLTEHLSDQTPVLWLLSGGSNIGLSVQIMQALPEELTQGLMVSLIDERYGPLGHPDSNWQQLLQAGFDAKEALLIPVLQADSVDMEATAQRWSDELEDAISRAGIVIGQLGMGGDGHIAGILPGTSATEPTDDMIVSYHNNDYDRISLSFHGLQQLDEAYLVVYSTEKHDQLQRLHDKSIDVAEQPVQIMKQLPQSFVYNDVYGGEV